MSDSLAARLTRHPLPHDRDRAARVLDGLDPALRGAGWDDLLGGTAGSSAYLAQLIERRGAWLARYAERSPEAILDRVLDRTDQAVRESTAQSQVATHLRWAKPRAALVIALADLGGVWDLDAVTGALTRLADRLTAAATDWLLAQEVRSGKLPGMTEDDLATGAGYVVLAMGKQGARELNFSSDIDLICLFDQDRFDPSDFAEAKARYIRLTRTLVKLMSEQVGGYVFRTDLRLRPSPSTTPVAMAMEAAENYYESVGRTWERAAHIKARPVAGDLAAGEAYLERLTPFVWRRHLDFPAIEDTHEMLRKIRGKQGRFSPGDLPGADVKRDPGGIREIELFAQTRQLVTGGRDPGLRAPRTVDALAALARAGWVETASARQLTADYAEHRALEHRLQMMEDAQTQTIPRQRDARERVAYLSGTDDLDAFERGIGERMARVHALTEEFYTPGGRARGEEEEAARRLDAAALAERGFGRPDDAAALLERWRSGKIAATRSGRARRLFAGLEPKIVEQLAAAANPGEAMAMFDRFLSGLPAGVQVFSLFTANPHLLDLIVDICAAAPRLAGHLGENPRALDALLDRDFFEPLAAVDDLVADLERWIGDEGDYERVLDLVRLWAREQTFRIGVQVLRALADREEAGAAFSDVAEATVRVLLPRVEAEFARRHGPPPGRGMGVIALGKLGSREMTAASDLDLITVYDAGGAEESEGSKPLAPSAYFPRLTKALVAALTAPTGEGRLYEVDMRLRPSGRAGPVAVSLSAFDSYQREKAWVWEHMAMTRARVIAGEPSLASDIGDIITRAVRARAEQAGIREAAAEMRARLIDAHRRQRGNMWSLKHAAGGLMEIEFLIQTGMLECGLADKPTARAAFGALVEQGWLEEAEAETLRKALGLMQRLQQMERVALEHPIDPATCGEGLRRAMTRAVNADSFENLEKWLADRQQGAAEIVEKRFPYSPT